MAIPPQPPLDWRDASAAYQSYFQQDIHWERFLTDARFRNFWIKAHLAGALLALFVETFARSVLPPVLGQRSVSYIIIALFVTLYCTWFTIPQYVGIWIYHPRGKFWTLIAVMAILLLAVLDGHVKLRPFRSIVEIE